MVHVGTSGWQYRDWRGSFYPAGLAQRRWLDHYGARFATVELNNPFYRLPERETFHHWREETPGDFVFAVKMSRFLTHVKRLRDPDEAVDRFLQHARGLGDKLGPVLLQLPPALTADMGRLAETLERFPSGIRIAVEPRHESWFQGDGLRRLLEERRAALCIADSPQRRSPVWRTARWGFVRFHEGRAAPHPCYGDRALATWAERIASLWGPQDEVFCYFNNDTNACAVRNAVTFARLVTRAGLRATRVPDPGEVRLAS
jgi:uncharacterized protein YecE (DUF72 family)